MFGPCVVSSERSGCLATRRICHKLCKRVVFVCYVHICDLKPYRQFEIRIWHNEQCNFRVFYLEDVQFVEMINGKYRICRVFHQCEAIYDCEVIAGKKIASYKRHIRMVFRRNAFWKEIGSSFV